MKLWLANIRELAGKETECMAMLTPGRREVALRYRREVDRLHKAAAGLLLRHVLNVTRDEEIILSQHGKPSLASGETMFSLSHNGCYAVLTVGDCEHGVDIEPITERAPIIPKRLLLEDELAWLGVAPSPERFAELWTRLESALKADGRGLDIQNRDFSVLNSGSPWHLNTFAFDGHVISCAAEVPFKISVTKLSANDLLGSVLSDDFK